MSSSKTLVLQPFASAFYGEAFSLPSSPHLPQNCPGAENGCTQHPWMTAETSNLLYLDAVWGVSWGSLFEADIAELEARTQTPEALAAAAAKAAREEAERLAYDQKMVAERNAIRAGATRTKHGPVQIQKIAQPCKKLYSCEGGGSKGGVAKPTTLHVSSECWAHEYTDASGKRVVKHVCQWLHPGESGWLPQWQADRNYRPDAVAAGLGALRGVVAPVARPSRFAPAPAAAQQAPAKPKSTNMWAAIDNSAW
jgi:hypothetical protein